MGDEQECPALRKGRILIQPAHVLVGMKEEVNGCFQIQKSGQESVHGLPLSCVSVEAFDGQGNRSLGKRFIFRIFRQHGQLRGCRHIGKAKDQPAHGIGFGRGVGEQERGDEPGQGFPVLRQGLARAEHISGDLSLIVFLQVSCKIRSCRLQEGLMLGDPALPAADPADIGSVEADGASQLGVFCVGQIH